ncbi:MAG: hypothetical protein DCC65_08230 [Planctomycetota bacterium]|nr:MAG: hypothetical protein DCC65_08230 [Planctomycetota bacterium]
MGAAVIQQTEFNMTKKKTQAASHHSDDRPLLAKSIDRYHDCYGGIGATVYETRFANGTRRYSVVFRRDVSDLALQGPFHSLGQDELMDLVAAASNAYHRINHLRFLRRCGDLPDVPFDQLSEADGWEPAIPEEYYASQIEES